MGDIRPITGRPATAGPFYERLLQSLGTDQFGPSVRDAVLSVTSGARRIYLFEATGPLDTSLQYFFGEPGLVELFPIYLKSYLRMDPVSDVYRAAPRSSDMALQRVRPLDIPSYGFRQKIFENAGIVERASVVQRGQDCWRVISVARHKSDGAFTEADLSALIDLSCMLLPMLPLNRRRRSTRVSLSVEQLEERFAQHRGDLTARERQVCARAAIGMSVEATASSLGIAKSSVVTYRQRAYRKLDVTNPLALCRLVAH